MYLKHTDIDKGKWDRTVEKSFNGLIYAYSWYLDAVSPGWEALVENDYESIMPLTANQKWGINYLRPAFITQQLGVFSTISDKQFSVDHFIDAIPKKYKLIDIHLNHYNKFGGSNGSLNANYELDLKQDFQLLFNGYSINTKRNIKKAEKEGLDIARVLELRQIIKIFKENKGESLTSVKAAYYNSLLRVYEQCRLRNCAEAYVVEKGGEPIAGAMFLRTSTRAIFMFSGSSEQGKKSKAMFLLINHFIKKHAGENLILDFEGSNIESLARFYRSFGAANVPYPSVKINRLPFWLNWAKKF